MTDRHIFKHTRKPLMNPELEENKIIIEDLLKDVRQQTLEDLTHHIEILVKDLNIYHCDRPINEDYRTKSDSYYAIHFENINLNLTHKDLDSIIYIGFGLDLNMQRNVLGFWLKKNSENPYKFWIKVCEQLKDSGINSIEVQDYNKQYWLNEAMNQVFGLKY